MFSPPMLGRISTPSDVLVLINRPRPSAESTAKLLRKRGHSVMIDPTYDIVPSRQPLPSVCPDAILLTSANAVHALDPPFLRLPVFTVGAATARAARRAGAVNVTIAGGDWQSLAYSIVSSEQLCQGATLLHPSGSEVRGELDGALAEANFHYIRWVVYQARVREKLARRVRFALMEGRVGAVLFFSPRAAGIWRHLVVNEANSADLSDVIAVCISEATARRIEDFGFREVRVAALRDHKSLADCLDDTE